MHQHGGNLFNVTQIYLTSRENDPLKKEVDIIEPKNKQTKKRKMSGLLTSRKKTPSKENCQVKN